MSSSASPGGEMATRSSDRPMRELAASVGKGTVEGNLERLAGAAVRFYGELLPMTASALADHQVSAWLRQRMPERGGGPVQGHAALIAYLEAERAAGRLGPTADPAFIAALLGACLQHAFLSLLADPAALAAVGLPPDAGEYARGVVRTVLAGHLPAAGRP